MAVLTLVHKVHGASTYYKLVDLLVVDASTAIGGTVMEVFTVFLRIQTSASNPLKEN